MKMPGWCEKRSFLHLQDWAKLLREYLRMARPGGVIRVTEGDWIASNTSPALSRLMELLGQAFYQAGHSFTPGSRGVTAEVADPRQKTRLATMQRCAPIQR